MDDVVDGAVEVEQTDEADEAEDATGEASDDTASDSKDDSADPEQQTESFSAIALADVSYETMAVDENATTYPVYVYVEEDGYYADGSTINDTTHWITIGKISGAAISAPSTSKESYDSTSSDFTTVVSLLSSITRYTGSTLTFSLDDVDWTGHGLKTAYGATDYSGEADGKTLCWHLDGKIVRGQVTINYYQSTDGGNTYSLVDTGKKGVKVGDNFDATTSLYSDTVTYANRYSTDGYAFNSTKSDPAITIEAASTGGAGQQYTVNLYYNKITTADYTVKYVDAQGNTIKDATTETGNVGETVTKKASDAPTIPGYELDENASNLSTEIKANPATGENTITYKYNKKTNLSYTVEYYWGTEGSDDATKIEGADTTVSGQTFGTDVTVTPTAPEGYTLRSADTKTVTINDDSANPNVVKFYCYKNATLTGNTATGVTYDGKDHKVDGYTVKSETGVTFEGITATTGAAVNAGSYTTNFSKSDGTAVVGTVDTTNMYIVSGTEAGGINISPRNLVLQSQDLSKVYDGTPLNAGGKVTVVSTAASDGTLVDGETLVYTFSGSQTEVGTSSAGNKFSIDWEKSTAQSSNYTISAYKYGNLTVTENSAEYVVHVTQTGGTTNSYTGDEQTVDFGWTVTKIDVPSNAPDLTASDIKFTGITDDLKLKGTDAGTYYSTGSTSDEAASALSKLFSVSDAKAFPHVTFVVTPASLVIKAQSIDPTSADYPKDSEGKAAGVTVTAPEDATYDGTSQQLKPTVKDAKGNELKEGTDYELSYSEDTTNAGEVTVTVIGKDNYSGTTSVKYQIKQREVNVTVNDATKTYDGTPLTASDVTVTSGNFLDGDKPSYTYTGSQTDAGTSTSNVSVKVADSQGNDVTKNYKVTPTAGKLTVTAQSIDPTSADYPKDAEGNPAGVTITAPEDATYDGTSQQLKPTVLDADGNTLEEGTDYELTYSEDTTNAGEVTVTVTGKGNYSGTTSVKYQIKPYDVTVTPGDWTCTYDGKEHNVTEYKVSSLVKGHQAGSADLGDGQVNVGVYKVSVVDGSVKFIDANGNDVTKNYNVKLATGTLTIKAQSIDPASDEYPTDADGNPSGVTADDPTDVTYDGNEHKFSPVVTDADGNVLVEGVDYDVIYSTDDFTNPGTVTVTIVGKGNFSGTITKTYKINPAETPAPAPTPEPAKQEATPKTGDASSTTGILATLSAGIAALGAGLHGRRKRD